MVLETKVSKYYNTGTAIVEKKDSIVGFEILRCNAEKMRCKIEWFFSKEQKRVALRCKLEQVL